MRLIDADALLERMKRTNRYFDVKFDIMESPAVDAEPVRHGRWVPVDGKHPCDEWDCTACGERRTFLVEMDADDMEECYPYCPNCGAKMDGDSHA